MDISHVLVWFLLGIAFFFTELTVPGFVLFFLGIGAWCTALVLAVADISLTIQINVFLVSSLVTMILLRSWIRSVVFSGSSDELDSVDIDFGSSTGVVTEAIVPPASGRVRYGGSFWRAVADEPIPEDTVVEIIKRKNLIVQVRIPEAGKEE